jgi:hypothetical protein
MRQITQKNGYPKLIFGSTLLALAIAMDAADVVNNVGYALHAAGAVLAVVFGVVAVAVVVLPVFAAVSAWTWELRLAHLVCVAMTVGAALAAYSEGMSAGIDASQGQQAAYEDARREIETLTTRRAGLEAEAKAITEQSPPAALSAQIEALNAQITTKGAADTKRMGEASCLKTCQALKAEKSKLETRKAEAESKQRLSAEVSTLDAKLAQAKADAANGPKAASGLTSDADTAKTFARAMSLAAIVATQAIAMLAHKAAKAIAEGWTLIGGRKPSEPKPARRTRKQSASIVSLDKARQAAKKEAALKLAGNGERLSYAEIGRRTSVPAATVAKWIKAAKKEAVSAIAS